MKNVFFNICILVIQNVIVNLISIFSVGYVANKLGNHEFGIFSLGFSYVTIYTAVGSLGLRQYAIREISKDRINTNTIVSKLLPARVTLIVLMSIVVYLSSILFGYSGYVVYIITLCLVNEIFDQFSRMFSDAFIASEKMLWISIRDICVKIIVSIMSVVFVYYGLGVGHVVFSYIFGSIVGLFINYLFYAKKFGHIEFVFDFRYIISSVKEGVGFAAIGIASIVMTKIDVIMISKLSDFISVSIYSAAVSLFYKTNIVSDSICTSFYPYFSNKTKKDMRGSYRAFSSIVILSIFISVPVCMFIFYNSGVIVELVYGSKYSGAADLLSKMSLLLPVLFLTRVCSYSLGAMGLQAIVAKVTIVGCILNVILNVVFIYKIGFVGALYATIVTQIIVFVLVSKKFIAQLVCPFVVKKTVFIIAFNFIVFNLIDSLYTVSFDELYLSIFSIVSILVYGFIGYKIFVRANYV
ncbi:MAG: flippase [Geothermobacteraceae bacterium]